MRKDCNPMKIKMNSCTSWQECWYTQAVPIQATTILTSKREVRRVVGSSSTIALSENLTSKIYQKSALARHLKTSRRKRLETCSLLGSVTQMPTYSFTRESTPQRRLKKSPHKKYHQSDNSLSLCLLLTTPTSSCTKVILRKQSHQLITTMHPLSLLIQ